MHDRYEIDAKKIKRLLLKIYRDYKRGLLTESQAFKEAALLKGLLHAIEVSDIQERLSKIERLMS